MADIFVDGFDAYGQPGTLGDYAGALMAGEWTNINLHGADGSHVVAPLSATGAAYRFWFDGGIGDTLTKTLPGSYGRIIGGFRFNADLGGGWGVEFLAGSTALFAIGISPNNGLIDMISGSLPVTNPTILKQSTIAVGSGQTHYLEWDVTVGSSGAYNVWLDGVLAITGSGNTGSSNVTVFGFNGFGTNSTNPTIDDLYLFDSTGGANNAPLLSNPVVNTAFVAADSQKTFSFGAGVVGAAGAFQAITGSSAPGANTLFLRQYIPDAAGMLESVSCMPGATSAGANFQPVCYADSSGAPGSLLSGGAQVTGTTSGTALTGALTTPQALTASVPVWIGFITDTSVALTEADAGTTGAKAANTYSSGAPANAPAMTLNQPDWMIWGTLSGVAQNWPEVANNPAIGDLSYVYSNTAGQEDLYQVGTVTADTATSIYTVCASALVRRTDTGARTFTLQCKSGSTDGSGSMAAATPGTSYEWLDSFFDVDPNTGLPWTIAGRNAAVFGEKIAS